MKQSLLSLGVVCAAFYSTPGWAQSERGFTLQEVTVTARRTEESLQPTSATWSLRTRISQSVTKSACTRGRGTGR
jgi:hypothetical protein